MIVSDHDYRAHRTPSHVPGLDEVLGGGFPDNSMQLVCGHTGTGKTTMGLQFVLGGLADGDPGLYVTLSQTRIDLERIAASHGWKLDQLQILDFDDLARRRQDESTLFRPDEVELLDICDLLVEVIEREGIRRMVLDTLCEMRLMADDLLNFRRQLLNLKQRFSRLGCTAMIIDDEQAVESDAAVRNLCDGLITIMHQTQPYGRDMRRLRLRKLRAGAYLGGYHDFRIRRGGITVYPRVVGDGKQDELSAGTVSTGVEGLDRLLDGGLGRGTRAVVFGPTGVGKSTLVCQLCAAAAARGEPAVIWSFDESRATMIQRLRDIIGGPVPELLRVEHLNPHAVSPGEFARGVWRAVEGDGVKVVALDTLNGLQQAIPDDRARTPQLQDLFSRLGEQGVLTVMTLAQWGPSTKASEQSRLSLLADTVIGMHYSEHEGRMTRSLGVIKKRSGAHEDRFHDFAIGRRGITVGGPVMRSSGLLSPPYGLPVG